MFRRCWSACSVSILTFYNLIWNNAELTFSNHVHFPGLWIQQNWWIAYPVGPGRAHSILTASNDSNIDLGCLVVYIYIYINTICLTGKYLQYWYARRLLPDTCRLYRGTSAYLIKLMLYKWFVRLSHAAVWEKFARISHQALFVEHHNIHSKHFERLAQETVASSPLDWLQTSLHNLLWGAKRDCSSKSNIKLIPHIRILHRKFMNTTVQKHRRAEDLWQAGCNMAQLARTLGGFDWRTTSHEQSADGWRWHCWVRPPLDNWTCSSTVEDLWIEVCLLSSKLSNSISFGRFAWVTWTLGVCKFYYLVVCMFWYLVVCI